MALIGLLPGFERRAAEPSEEERGLRALAKLAYVEQPTSSEELLSTPQQGSRSDSGLQLM